ncbi:hypothetical protein [Moraxella bovis]|uniref:hypothetical protein n=1 Tax=Moraxella bovis TaxID=476 RepID=UPI000992413E|nr:hypothetical protein [Moraxella bovis]OOR90563.1 hypothetical protein B0182_05035 [Moraxella bovis]
MNKFILMVFCMVALTACQSTHKLPMPKGKWTAVNTPDFIPPNTVKYRDDVSTLNQDLNEAEQQQVGETQ